MTMDGGLTLGETATGKPKIVIARDVGHDSFELHAQAFVDRFGLSVKKKLSVQRSLECPIKLTWVGMLEDHELCISWDDWCSEVNAMAWGDTPDEVVHDILGRA